MGEKKAYIYLLSIGSYSSYRVLSAFGTMKEAKKAIDDYKVSEKYISTLASWTKHFGDQKLSNMMNMTAETMTPLPRIERIPFGVPIDPDDVY